MDAKTCSICWQTKRLSDFYRRGRKASSSYRSECKACSYRQWKTWYSRPDSRERKSGWPQRYYGQPMDAKTCSVCWQTKPLSDFYRRRERGPRSYHPECKACSYRQWKTWYSRPRNREKKIGWLRRYYRQHHDQALAKRREYHKRYYLRNKDGLYLKHRAYITSPRGREVQREANRRHRARQRGAMHTPSVLTVEDWKLLLDDFDYACAWCGVQFSESNSAEQDHIVPVSRGGLHTLENIVPACRSCSSRWQDKEKPLPSAWLAFHRQSDEESKAAVRSASSRGTDLGP